MFCLLLSRTAVSSSSKLSTRAAASNNPQVLRTRSHILNSTRRLLVEQGYRSITVDGISQHSGASRTTIYRHWPKIEDLLFDAFATLVGDPFEAPDTGDFREDLRIIVRQYVDAISDSEVARLLPSFVEAAASNEHLGELLSALVKNSRTTSLQILQRAKKRGQLHKDANNEWILDQINGPILYRLLLSKKSIKQRGFVRHLIEKSTNN